MSRQPRRFAALFWKEVVELTRYSVPLFVLYAVFIGIDARPETSLRQVMQPAERFIWFGFFNALAGALMGFSQTTRERAPDAWAFAVHRPVRRSQVFLAKMLAGQLSLLCIAGIPYAIAMAWLATPGHVAVPFDGHMWQPGAGDLLVGLVFHATGLLVGARRKGTFSRYLGFIAAILGGAMSAAVSTFWVAVVICLVFGSVLLGAAWATFISADDRAGQPALGQISNAVVLLPTLAVVYIAGSIAWDIFRPGPALPFPVRAEPVREALVAPDGRIVRATIREKSTPIGDDHYVEDAVDLDGHALPEVAQALSVSPAGNGVIVTGNLQAWARGNFSGSYRSPSRWVQRLYPGRPGGQLWYFERRHHLISVYGDSTRRREGWIGPDGFVRGDSMPARRYEGDLITSWMSPSDYLVFEGAVYSVKDYPERPALVFRAPAGDTIVDVGRPSFSALGKKGYAPGPWTFFTAITTTRGVYLIDETGRVELMSPHPTRPAEWTNVRVWRAPNAPGKPTFIWYPSGYDSLNHVLEYRMGNTAPVARYQFAGPTFEPRSVGDGVRRSISMSAVGPSSSSGSSFSLMPLAPWGGMDWEIGTGREDPPSKRVIIRSLILAVLTMIPIWLIGRRYAFSTLWRAGWMALALIAGPFTLLALWLSTDFPAREKCPACGKMRVVNRERCEHCDAPFPAPDPDGTEVFAY